MTTAPPLVYVHVQAWPRIPAGRNHLLSHIILCEITRPLYLLKPARLFYSGVRVWMWVRVCVQHVCDVGVYILLMCVVHVHTYACVRVVLHTCTDVATRRHSK